MSACNGNGRIGVWRFKTASIKNTEAQVKKG